MKIASFLYQEVVSCPILFATTNMISPKRWWYESVWPLRKLFDPARFGLFINFVERNQSGAGPKITPVTNKNWTQKNNSCKWNKHLTLRIDRKGSGTKRSQSVNLWNILELLYSAENASNDCLVSRWSSHLQNCVTRRRRSWQIRWVRTNAMSSVWRKDLTSPDQRNLQANIQNWSLIAEQKPFRGCSLF